MNKQNAQNNETECNAYKSLRVKNPTKNKVAEFLKKVNSDEDCGKISCDELIDFFISNATPQDVEKLRLSSITWEHEDRRLRKLYEKKKGKISEARWREMVFLGQLQKFISEHSRLPLGAA